MESEGSSLTSTARVRIEMAPRDAMPDGCLVVPVEKAGKLIWVVREGEMSDALREEINVYLEHITHSGLWEQHWEQSGEEPPTSHPH